MWCLVMDDGTHVPISESKHDELTDQFLLLDTDEQEEAHWLHPNWQILDGGEWVNLDHVRCIIWEERKED